jgi:hypothetical protein
MRWIMDLFVSVFESLFGCRHSNLSRPFTIDGQTYKVCMECSSQVFYSKENMRPLRSREVRVLRAQQAAAAVAVMPATAAGREAVARRSKKSAAA